MAYVIVAIIVQLPSLEVLLWFLSLQGQYQNNQDNNFRIYAWPHSCLQCIYKMKFIYLIGLLFMLFQSQPQALPDPPVQVLSRIISIDDLLPSFVKGFCGYCDPMSSTCYNNFYAVSEIPSVKFTIQNITNNPYNITRFKSFIETVNGSYSFPSQEHNLKNVAMRYLINAPKDVSNIKGVILYNHPTTFGKSQVPTVQGPQIAAISALYISSGYALVFPNYLGYQLNDQYPHPYVLYPQQNVKAAIHSLNQAIKTLQKQYPSINQFNLFSVGYSQGAAYSVWLQKCLQSAENCQGAKLDSAYIFRGAAGLEGPYDLLNTVKHFLTQKVSEVFNNTFKVQTQLITNFGKPPLLSMTIISYMYFSMGKNNYENFTNTEFWAMRCTDHRQQKNCMIQDFQYDNIFKAIKSSQKSLDIAKAISFSAFGKTYNDGKRYLGSTEPEYTLKSDNSVFGLASEAFMNDKVFNETLNNASALNNQPTKKVFLFSLMRDSVVPVNNTESFQSKFRSKVQAYYFDNKQHKICQQHGNATFAVDHNGAQVLSNIFALAFIKSINGV